MNFEKAVEFVMSKEGGYVNDPDDSGGETKWGISKRSYPAIDIRNLAASDAVGIYQKDYWLRLRCGELPRGLDFLVFDAAVNQGPAAAVWMLQQAGGVNVDGIMGPVTLKAAKNVSIAEYAARRMAMYAVAKTFSKHGLGWARRLMDAVILATKDAA